MENRDALVDAMMEALLERLTPEGASALNRELVKGLFESEVDRIASGDLNAPPALQAAFEWVTGIQYTPQNARNWLAS